MGEQHQHDDGRGSERQQSAVQRTRHRRGPQIGPGGSENGFVENGDLSEGDPTDIQNGFSFSDADGASNDDISNEFQDFSDSDFPATSEPSDELAADGDDPFSNPFGAEDLREGEKEPAKYFP